MPIRPQPRLIYCPQCRWQTRWHPKSDALLPSDLPPAACPKCGNENLESRADTGLAGLLGRLFTRQR